MTLKVFLMGGTKDSTNIIEFIKDNYDSFILTTTTTNYGAKIAENSGSDETIARALPKEDIIKILNGNTFDVFIDATHPFAEHVTRTAIETSKICNIPYIRFERPTLNLENIDTSRIKYVNSFYDAGKLIERDYNDLNVLHLAGSNTIGEIIKFVNVKNFYPRVLNVKSSIEKCINFNIPQENIVTMKNASTKEENIDLIKKTNASVVISKDSGEIGGVLSKIEASNETNTDIIIIKRPIIETLEKKDVVKNLKQLNEKILRIKNAETGI